MVTDYFVTCLNSGYDIFYIKFDDGINKKKQSHISTRPPKKSNAVIDPYTQSRGLIIVKEILKSGHFM